ncbi:(2Fe-2S)-binding protein [Roseomonas sp. CCTCC AB2023176]|uniref:(2Fe-2S)-binding protein n=1 Tax=Roseomonas sp. CCTCC AB2023176 TaxID=3342640 RepID=UPI0035D703FE
MTLIRLLDQDRPALTFTVDGAPVAAKRGDTLLTAILAGGLGHLRTSEFGDGPRAGFCLMGACQDCWMRVDGLGTRRACTTLAEDGMAVTRR